MKNLLKQKKILFDGDEENFHTMSSKIKCFNCSGTIEIDSSRFFSISKITDKKNLELVSEVKGIKSTNVGDKIFYKYEYLPVVSADVSCDSCKKIYKAILGAGEYQPARYMAVLGGIF